MLVRFAAPSALVIALLVVSGGVSPPLATPADPPKAVDFDRDVKGPLYAENGIVEYWIANLDDRCLEVRRQPRSDGTYADVRTLRPGDTADVAALPGVTVAVAEIL